MKQSVKFELVQQSDRLSETEIQSAFSRIKGLKRWLYILHDADLRSDGTPVKPHYHIYLQYDSPRLLSSVANMFGVPAQYVNYVKGSYKDAVCYAFHLNAPDKHQYPFNVAVSNFDIQQFLNTAPSISLQEILTRISDGTICKYNLSQYCDIFTYVKNAQKIENAFRYADMFSTPERHMHVYYLYGVSGVGKTTLAKLLCADDAIFVSSGTNDPFYGYKGEPNVILDDLRPDTFPFVDLLKILDPYTSSTVRARYRNIVLRARNIYITSTYSPYDYKTHDEDLAQFFRRLTAVYHLQFGQYDVYFPSGKTLSYDSSVSFSLNF